VSCLFAGRCSYKLLFAQQLALAAQLHLAQDDNTNGLGGTEVERTNSSKVPWLVVGPDGIELAIAHKVRVAPPTNLSDEDTSKVPLVRLACMFDREHMLLSHFKVLAHLQQLMLFVLTCTCGRTFCMLSYSLWIGVLIT